MSFTSPFLPSFVSLFPSPMSADKILGMPSVLFVCLFCNVCLHWSPPEGAFQPVFRSTHPARRGSSWRSVTSWLTSSSSDGRSSATRSRKERWGHRDKKLHSVDSVVPLSLYVMSEHFQMDLDLFFLPLGGDSGDSGDGGADEASTLVIYTLCSRLVDWLYCSIG